MGVVNMTKHPTRPGFSREERPSWGKSPSTSGYSVRDGDVLASVASDLLRVMIKEFGQQMMDAKVEGVCGPGYGEVPAEPMNSRNGYRRREWDTRAGTVGPAIPSLWTDSYYLEWHRRAERTLANVAATSYLLGVSTRRVEKLAQSLGVTKLSKSLISIRRSSSCPEV